MGGVRQTPLQDIAKKYVGSDEVWEEAARHYGDDQLGALVLSIATINTWNRLNAATRQITGEWVEQLVAAQMAGASA